jgi:thioredoxin-like negative regulator of GroEL
MLKHVDTLKMLKIVRVDIDLNKDFMKQYDILGVPVLMLLFNGVEVMRLGGSLNFEEFKEWIHRIEDFKELS